MSKIDARKLSSEIQQHNRTTAVRLLLEGYTRDSNAVIVGVHRMTVAKWIAAYNQLGLDGLELGQRGRKLGAKRLLNEAQEARLKEIVLDNNPSQMKLDFALWSGTAIRRLIWDSWRIELSTRTTRKYLKRWGSRRKGPSK